MRSSLPQHVLYSTYLMGNRRTLTAELREMFRPWCYPNAALHSCTIVTTEYCSGHCRRRSIQWLKHSALSSSFTRSGMLSYSLIFPINIMFTHLHFILGPGIFSSLAATHLPAPTLTGERRRYDSPRFSHARWTSCTLYSSLLQKCHPHHSLPQQPISSA